MPYNKFRHAAFGWTSKPLRGFPAHAKGVKSRMEKSEREALKAGIKNLPKIIFGGLLLLFYVILAAGAKDSGSTAAFFVFLCAPAANLPFAAPGYLHLSTVKRCLYMVLLNLVFIIVGVLLL